ncbi:Agamous-like MADS-box protein AGL80 [Striga hermonthica]|uniref:Agamous-like MADS-box protein AGL80 n=1 Tax=Striga hermonthica TaxID=68872 RepID=A0A9N7NZM5_STRHE|nr:Agamous-like MADS-box protein AGL80 [Striga hermonthica]
MTRKKVKLAFISNDSSRKATFKKRKKGLMKKVSELSTLCGIEACAIVYSPYEAQPDVWPDGRGGAQRVLAHFKRMPEMEQSKKMVNQEMFLSQRGARAADHLKKLRKDNREKEMTRLMYECLTGRGVHGLPPPDLNDVTWLLDRSLKEIYSRIEALRKDKQPAQQQPWFSEWTPHLQGGGGGEEDHMMMPQPQGTNTNTNTNTNVVLNNMWSNVFFP